MRLPSQAAALEAQLCDFDPHVRAETLAKLTGSIRDSENISEQDVFNLHCHTFFSFNAYGYSPSALAWLAKKNGYRLIGIVDFDVLDGVDEFLAACESLHVRGATGMETRIFLPEFAAREINSPGEPGVSYFMGVGFTSSTVPAEVKPVLDGLRQRACNRNKQVLERVNSFLSPITVDYENDLIPLTPRGNLTERHLVRAILLKVERAQDNPLSFWQQKLGLTKDEVASASNPVYLQNLIRARLMKRGGVGYIQPNVSTFPTIQEVNRLTTACGAIPCAAWLDGTSQGETDIEELLDLLIQQGVAALNIIPDRNWNIADRAARDIKVNKLYEIVRLANEHHLPLIIGTEMNSFGQRIIDDFDAPELQPVRQPFLDGAYFLYGHTMLQRALGLGFQSAWAKAFFPKRADRNKFFSKIGYKIPPGSSGINQLHSMNIESTPEQFLSSFSSDL